MIIVNGNNFSEIYLKLLDKAVTQEIKTTDSRNGPVVDLGPAFFEVTNEDLLRLPILEKRSLNPFFALTEFSWIINGSNDLEPLNYFINNFNKFSDDGITLNGAYGYRLRNLNGVDQLKKAIDILREEQSTRRVVLSMWAIEDLGSTSRDVPCNTSLMLKIRNNQLDMTVVNRSNDLFLGVPYNVVVFYLLQCYIAAKIGCRVGSQRHFTDSLHLYSKHLTKAQTILENNSLEKIKRLYSRFKKVDLSSYIEENHVDIIKRKYKKMKEPYKSFFSSHELYKLGSNCYKSIGLLPKNLLGYSGYLWFKEKESFESFENFFDVDNYYHN